MEPSDDDQEAALPGGRLTQHDRRQIAQGLAADLPYAEIARRLDRPTSTVTREVNRNGGASAYRAEQAHRATERRSHRRREPSRTATRATTRSDGRDAAAVREYEAVFTAIMVRQGVPTMMARVLTCLYTTDAGSLTAAELVERLGVSAGSISKAVAGLEELGLVSRERGEGRRERYVADGDVWYQSIVAAARTNADLASTAREGVAVLGAGTPAGIRLQSMAQFLDFVGDSLTQAAHRARELFPQTSD
ncbi:helix-turn-helix domain-containing protein [Cellulomonas sp. HZM]|uniref:GbsR/MarR family transcriptional regulator n=1 Tax=Cellulomonas sp. HZM TaxID=1454010 RepID=UPI000AF2D112|nr:helix-turn-helix domain-containing protein [Cellulomonas sp. HZM]